MTKMKVCTRCHKELSLSEFHVDSSSPSGYQSKCKECRCLERRLRYAKSGNVEKERKRERMADPQYAAAVRERQNAQRAQNRPAVRAKHRAWYQENKHKRRAQQVVKLAVGGGQIPAARDTYCRICHKDAADHHHPSYMESDRLNVVPLCKSCHSRVHHSPDLLSECAPTVVALHMGSVRIAVAFR